MRIIKRHIILITVTVTLFFIACGTESEPGEPPFASCENGFVLDLYPCSNVGLYSRVTLDEMNGVRGNDIWGWTDPESSKEYALVGLTDGVSFVDVTNPAEPVFIGKLEESTASPIANPIPAHDDEAGDFKESSAWRDLKVYRNYLFVVSEERGHGMQVFDLTRIRNTDAVPSSFTQDALYSEIGNAHNIAINEESGYAYIVGSTSGNQCAESGGLHIVDIRNPLEPRFAGCHVEPDAGGVIASGYIHDTQCVTYRGPDTDFAGRELCFSSSERKFLISDVTDKGSPETVAVSGYNGNQYSHQGWLSEDHSFFYMNDELDERNNHHNTRTYVWDLSDLESPRMTGFFNHDTGSVDHNLYIYDNIAYQANYTAGLRVLDISGREPDAIRESGFFDTTPENNEPEFAGLWSNYPFFSGNKIIVSDINQGVFILRYDRGQF